MVVLSIDCWLQLLYSESSVIWKEHLLLNILVFYGVNGPLAGASLDIFYRTFKDFNSVSSWNSYQHVCYFPLLNWIHFSFLAYWVVTVKLKPNCLIIFSSWFIVDLRFPKAVAFCMTQNKRRKKWDGRRAGEAGARLATCERPRFVSQPGN